MKDIQLYKNLDEIFTDERRSEIIRRVFENKTKTNLSIRKMKEGGKADESDVYTPYEFLHELLPKVYGRNYVVSDAEAERMTKDIEKEEAVLSFFVPSLWKDYLAIRFPLSSFSYVHFLGNQLIQTSKFLRNQMHVWVENDLAYVLMRKNGKLQIANAYPCTSATELAFYLHSIRESFDIIWTNDTFSIKGNRLENSDFQQQLLALSIPLPTTHEQV